MEFQVGEKVFDKINSLEQILNLKFEGYRFFRMLKKSKPTNDMTLPPKMAGIFFF